MAELSAHRCSRRRQALSSPLTIAVPKGRILTELQPLLAPAGIDLSPFQKTRKLLFDSEDGKLRLVLLRASDVPTYVTYGVADVGVCGGDTLAEIKKKCPQIKLCYEFSKYFVFGLSPI